jgi:molybdenum cofactor biosynthesis enzyme MoaA
MPQVKCPQCGTIRLIVEGKIKKCKCGMKLTSDMPAVKLKEEPVDKKANQQAATTDKKAK